METHMLKDSMTLDQARITTVRLRANRALFVRLILKSEMSNMNSNDPNRILNECRAVDAAVDELEGKLQRLKATQAASVNATDPKTITPALDQETQELLSSYRRLVDRMKRIKQDKDSGNPRNAPQVGRVDRKVKSSMNNFQKADSEYRQKLQSRMERDYRIVRPDASDAEVREAVQDPSNTQVFSQALINSDRRGEAQNVASQVRTRHAAIQKIEKDMLELAQMFQDLDALVVQQEAQVTQIEQRGEEVREDVTKANVELDGAVTKARAARKKKWICLGIAGEFSPSTVSCLPHTFLLTYLIATALCLSNMCPYSSSGGRSRHCNRHWGLLRCQKQQQ